MPRRCTICHHEERDAIDRLLSGGGAISAIGAEWAVSTDALKRHKANHLLPEMREKLAEDPDLRDVDILAEMKGLYARGCYELAQEWLANAENGRPTVNRANRGIRILMRFFSQVHNTL